MLMSKVAAQREGAVILVVDKGTAQRRRHGAVAIWRRNSILGGSGGKAAAQRERLSAVAIAIRRRGRLVSKRVARRGRRSQTRWQGCSTTETARQRLYGAVANRRRNSTLGGKEQSRSQSGGEAAAQRDGAVQPWALARG